MTAATSAGGAGAARAGGCGAGEAVEPWPWRAAADDRIGTSEWSLPRRRVATAEAGVRCLRIASWNYGSAAAGRVAELVEWAQGAAVDVLCVQETRVPVPRVLREAWRRETRKALGHEGVSVVAAAEPTRGGVAVLVMPSAARHLAHAWTYGATVAGCELQYYGATLEVASVYAPQQGVAARTEAAMCVAEATERWMAGGGQRTPRGRGRLVAVLGDVNEVAGGDGRWPGRADGSASEDTSFLDWAAAAGLVDTYAARGWAHTFLRESLRRASRIDHAFVSAALAARVAGAAVDYSASPFGDRHCPLVVDLQVSKPAEPERGPRLRQRPRLSLLAALRGGEAARARVLARLAASARSSQESLAHGDLESAADIIVGALPEALRPEAGGMRRGGVSGRWRACAPSRARALGRLQLRLRAVFAPLMHEDPMPPTLAVRAWNSAAAHARVIWRVPFAPALAADVVAWAEWRVAVIERLAELCRVRRKLGRGEARDGVRRGLAGRVHAFATPELFSRFVGGILKPGGTQLVDSAWVCDEGERRRTFAPTRVAAEARAVFEAWTAKRPVPWVVAGTLGAWQSTYDAWGASAKDADYSRLCASLTSEEYFGVLDAVWKRSSPGPSGVAYQHVSEIPREHVFHVALLAVLNECLRAGCVPRRLRRGLLRPIPKGVWDGDLQRSRPITLCEVLFKILNRVITRRLEDALTRCGVLPGGNFAGTRGCGTTHPLHILRSVLECSAERRAPLALGLLDVRRAFDAMAWPSLELTLNTLGVPAPVVSLFRSLYADFQCEVVTAYGLSASYTVGRGCLQGLPSSGLMWILFYMPLIVRLRALAASDPECGFVVRACTCSARGGGGRAACCQQRCASGAHHACVFSLVYADDVLLIASSAAGLQRLCDAVTSFCALHGLELVTAKTIVVDALSREPYVAAPGLLALRVGGDPVLAASVLSPMAALTFLGVTFTASLSVLPQLEVSLTRARESVAQLEGRALTLPMVRYVVRTVLFPRLAYSLSLHPCTEAQCLRLERVIFQWARRALRMSASFPADVLASALSLGLGRLYDVWAERVIPECELLLNSPLLAGECMRARRATLEARRAGRDFLRFPWPRRPWMRTWLGGVERMLLELGLAIAERGRERGALERWLAPRHREGVCAAMHAARLEPRLQCVFAPGSACVERAFMEPVEGRLARPMRDALHGRQWPYADRPVARDALYPPVDWIGAAWEDWRRRVRFSGAPVVAWGDGSCSGASGPLPRERARLAAAVVFEEGARAVSPDRPLESTDVLTAWAPGPPHSTSAELAHLIGVLRMVPADVPLVCYTDSQAALAVIATARARAQDPALAGVQLRQRLRSPVRIWAERARSAWCKRLVGGAATEFVHVPAHTGRADLLCNARADSEARAAAAQAGAVGVPPHPVLVPRLDGFAFAFLLVHSEEADGAAEAVGGDPVVCVRQACELACAARLRFGGSSRRGFYGRQDLDWGLTLEGVRVDHMSRRFDYRASREAGWVQAFQVGQLPLGACGWRARARVRPETCPRCDEDEHDEWHMIRCREARAARGRVQATVDRIMPRLARAQGPHMRGAALSTVVGCLAVSEDRPGGGPCPAGVAAEAWSTVCSFAAVEVLACRVPLGLADVVAGLCAVEVAVARTRLRSMHAALVRAFGREFWAPYARAAVARRREAVRVEVAAIQAGGAAAAAAAAAAAVVAADRSAGREAARAAQVIQRAVRQWRSRRQVGAPPLLRLERRCPVCWEDGAPGERGLGTGWEPGGQGGAHRCRTRDVVRAVAIGASRALSRGWRGTGLMRECLRPRPKPRRVVEAAAAEEAGGQAREDSGASEFLGSVRRRRRRDGSS